MASNNMDMLICRTTGIMGLVISIGWIDMTVIILFRIPMDGKISIEGCEACVCFTCSQKHLHWVFKQYAMLDKLYKAWAYDKSFKDAMYEQLQRGSRDWADDQSNQCIMAAKGHRIGCNSNTWTNDLSDQIQIPFATGGLITEKGIIFIIRATD